jgi:hypothetical protein
VLGRHVDRPSRRIIERAPNNFRGSGKLDYRARDRLEERRVLITWISSRAYTSLIDGGRGA